MREEDLMKLLAGIGGVIALIEAISGLGGKYLYSFVLISGIAGIVLAILVLFSIFKPDDPIPFNWIFFVVVGILMIILSSVIGGILVLVGGFVGYSNNI